MKIDVSELCKINGNSAEFDVKNTFSELYSEHQDYQFNRPVYVRGKVVNSGGRVIAEGDIETDYLATCAKCLSEKECQLKLQFREVFVNTDSADDMYEFDGKYIDLEQAVFDNIIFSLPLKYICSKDCKGLCSRCGINLNKKQCSCPSEVIDERLQKLGDYFNKK